MDCIVSIYYKDSGFDLEPCDFHRKKRHTDSNEKELEYKVEIVVEEPISATTTPDNAILTPTDTNIINKSGAAISFATVGIYLSLFVV